MIHSVFELGDTLVREVMVPRPDVVWVERDTTVEKVLRLALRSGYSRLPVLGESIDDIIGVAYLKDLVRAQSGGQRRSGADGPAPGLLPTSCAARCSSPTQAVDELLKEMQAAAQPHGDRRRRVRRHRGRRDDRGHPRGDRRGDHRRVRRRGGARRPALDGRRRGSRPGCRSRTSRSSSPYDYADYEADERSRRGAARGARGRGRRHGRRPARAPARQVPLPGSEAEVAGLQLRAEGGKDARGRLRITSVLVTPPPDESADVPRHPPRSAGGDEAKAALGAVRCTERRFRSIRNRHPCALLGRSRRPHHHRPFRGRHATRRRRCPGRPSGGDRCPARLIRPRPGGTRAARGRTVPAVLTPDMP